MKELVEKLFSPEQNAPTDQETIIDVTVQSSNTSVHNPAGILRSSLSEQAQQFVDRIASIIFSIDDENN